MTAYDSAEWSDLFVATAGAAAALAGLVFVAVSINIDRILKFEGLPERALETVLLLLGVVVASIIGLVPGQDTSALGAELLVAGLLVGWAIAVLSSRGRPEGSEERSRALIRLAIQLLGTAPFAIGGISVLAESGGGLYWIAAGTVFAISGAVLNAWVLLVEILR